jgi:type IV pilus assembly protein PilY1
MQDRSLWFPGRGALASLGSALLVTVAATAASAADDVCASAAASRDRASAGLDAAVVGAVALTAAGVTALPLDHFAQSRHLDALFVGMFAPREGARWPGNLKRYRLRLADGAVLDADGRRAIDPTTGLVADDARSDWSATADGADVEAGGSANRIPSPELRSVYTFLGDPRLDAPSNRVSADNEGIDQTLLGASEPNAPSREQIIDFIRGSSANAGGELPRPRLGAMLHTPPVAVAHGSAEADVTVYVVTDDGHLHAVDAATGIEQWTFVPPELMPLQSKLLAEPTPTGEHYGIDGALRIRLVTDAGTGERPRAHLYFGLGRGGSAYYALDVTEPRNPIVLWRLGADELPDLGQSWSSPVPARMKIAGAGQSPDLGVLVLGGGHDPAHDGLAAAPAALGSAIYIVDATSGRLLWHGGPVGRDARFADMRYPIPAEVRVVDLTGDGLADRWYAADLGGQVWRFDVFNGSVPDGLIAGSVIARLGAAGGQAAVVDARRFFHAPDVALALRPGGAFIHIGIGSGHRPRPNNFLHHDRFYALRDHAPFALLDQVAHDSMLPVRDAQLIDITDDAGASVPHTSPGWRLELRDGGWRGEKVLAEARTFDDKIYFTTFTPHASADPEACEPVPLHGATRLYVLDVESGAPAASWAAEAAVESSQPGAPAPDAPSPPTPSLGERYRELPGAVPGVARFIFPAPVEAGDCAEGACGPRALACIGLACFDTGFESRPVRTYWSEDEGYWSDAAGDGEGDAGED